MLTNDTTLYFSSISFNYYHDHIWQKIYNECPYDGQFFINISRRLNPCRFVTRNGEWSLPWKQELVPGFEMPEYDPSFKKTFTEISDRKANDIKARIEKGEKFAVMFSGGIDSTVIMASLLKNLQQKHLRSIIICASSETLIENPVFWKKYIQNNFKILDSQITKYDDLLTMGYTPITADEGDCIFGTLFGLTLYNNFDYYLTTLSSATREKLGPLKYRISDPNVHYSTYADILIKHLGIAQDPEFGKILYEKYVHNINTASVPVNSLHDFFWWLIFNVKYLNCSVRGAIYLNDRIDTKTAVYSIINWFNDSDYQLWSMVNNNNGQKIRNTVSTYKWAAKEYIWDFDHNDWYRSFKIKLESLWNVGSFQKVDHIEKDRRPVARVGLTKDWQMLYIDDPAVQDFYKHHLSNYKIDWI